MKPKGLYLVNHESFENVFDRTVRQEIGELIDIEEKPVTKADLAEDTTILKPVEIIMASWGCPMMDMAFLNAVPNLKAVFYAAGSIRPIISDEFWDRNIIVSSAYAANAIPVAEYTVAMILFSLKLGWQHVCNGCRRKAWPERLHVPGAYGTTIGLISFGMIGRIVHKLLKSFELPILVYDPFLSDEEAKVLNIENVTLEELFERSQVVSLHTPLLPETEGMITDAHILSMGKEATFINTARGAVVDEPGMIRALQQRPDIYAILDVTHPEPPAPDSPLHELSNVILTPHIAGSMDKECSRMGQYMLEELRRYIAGEPLRWQVTQEQAAIRA
jgi:phosphoglycerate dehydrogenase-like enzyme